MKGKFMYFLPKVSKKIAFLALPLMMFAGIAHAQAPCNNVVSCTQQGVQNQVGAVSNAAKQSVQGLANGVQATQGVVSGIAQNAAQAGTNAVNTANNIAQNTKGAVQNAVGNAVKSTVNNAVNGAVNSAVNSVSNAIPHF